MRQRSILAIGLVATLTGVLSILTTGCEDGPSQTFTPAPSNAGNLWNNGNPDASVADGKAPFDAAFGSISALQQCTADQKRLVWANMLEQPMVPPFQYAGLNLAYSQNFTGITLKEAEGINCVGNPAGEGAVTWGDNGEVAFFYTESNYVVDQVEVNLGYQGTMTFHQRVGAKNAQGNCAVVSRFESSPTEDPDPTHCTGHTYILQIGQPILKDGKVYEIDWAGTGADDSVNEIYNGLMATFGRYSTGYSTTGDYDSVDCTGDGTCQAAGPSQAAGNGGACFFQYTPLGGISFETDCTTSNQPTVSIPILVAQNYYLFEPYSDQASVATINAQGPVALPRFNSTTDPSNCYIQLGMDWKTYIENCVDLPQPQGGSIDPGFLDAGFVGSRVPLTYNQINENIAVASPQHDDETFQFSVVGLAPLIWVDETVESQPQAIVLDTDVPSVNDAIQARVGSFYTSLYDEGVPINDTVGTSFTGQGSAYVYREWTRLLQADINKILTAAHPTNVVATGPNAGSSIYNHPIGDPACFTTPTAAAALGCTGLESLAIQANSQTTFGDPGDQCQGATPAPICNNLSLGSAFFGFKIAGYGATVLRPAYDYSIFCQDPAAVATEQNPFATNCNFYQLWPGALAQVQAVAGVGNLNNLPQEIADIRYYFRWYGIAMIKYLKAYGANASATASEIAAQTLDLESIFFDTLNLGGGTFQDSVEYIERSFMTNTPATYVGNVAGSAGSAGAVTVPASFNAIAEDFNLSAFILSGYQLGTGWSKFMFRPETALFNAMLETKTDLPGIENNVNVTNLAGSALLQQNYASYECATQWPTVTIPGQDGTPDITGAWADVCQYACPAYSTTNLCPYPPLLPPDASGNQTLQLDLNGTSPGLGLGGTTPRLGNYKAVWGKGAACADANSPSTPTYALNPTAVGNNPYTSSGGQPSPCAGFTNGYPIPTGVGSVFAVGQKPAGAARVSFVGATATNLTAGTNPNNLTAFVNIPNMPNPFNAVTLTGDPAPTNIQVTAPYVASVGDVGFNIPINATEDKFWQTATIQLGGILESYSLDVVPFQDPITHAYDGTLTVDAIEGDDFLGEAFLCQDVNGDLLGAHMYDSASSILTWISDHPASELNCNIIVRYSIYDNYVDFITSLSAGVQLDINQGGGYGRVVGVIAYDPTLSSAP